MAEINDINIESADYIKKAMIESTFSKVLRRFQEGDFDPITGDWNPETKELLKECGLIKVDDSNTIIPCPSDQDLDKDIKKRISSIVNILKYCVDNDIDIKSADVGTITQLLKQMIADGVVAKTNKKVNMDAINFIRQNKEISIVFPESVKRHCDSIDMVSGKMEIEPGRKMSEFEAVALFDYAAPIIRDRIVLPINKKVRDYEKIKELATQRGELEESIREGFPLNSSFPELERVNGYYEFLETVTRLITKATKSKDDAKTKDAKERALADLRKLKEIKENFILEVGKEIAYTVKIFAMPGKSITMETRRSKIEHDRLGVPEGLIPFLYEDHISAENFDELLSTVCYLSAAKKYREEVTGVHEVAKPRKKRESVSAELDKELTFNAYEEIGTKFGLNSSKLISEMLLQDRNVFAFEKFMGSRLEYEYEKANIARQLRDMEETYEELLEENGKPVEVFRAGVLDDTGSMPAKRREHPYSADKHVESGSKIKTSYISLTESPLIMGQFLYPFNSTNERTVPTIVDMRVIYQQLKKRYQELESRTFKFAGQDEFLECLIKYAETNLEKRDEILRKIEVFKEQNKGAIPYERNMEHPEGFVSRKSVESMPNTYSRTSAELLLKGIIPAESITQMDYLTSDILQRVCNNDAFDSVLNASRNRKHNILENLNKFIGDESNLEDLELEEYELDFIKQYYIKGIPLEDIVSIPNAEGADNIELLAIGTKIRNDVTKKLLMNDKFLKDCLNVSSKDAEIIKNRMQDLYTAKMSKTSDKYTDKQMVAKDKKADSGLYQPFDSDCKKKYIVADIKVVPKERSGEITIKRYSKVPVIKTVVSRVRNGMKAVEEKGYEIEVDDKVYPFEVRYQAKNAARKMKETSVIYHMEPKGQETEGREENR